ncbi:hypothetical protein [Xanthomonas sp. GPE 39]|uniref:hypothetical protein n=1 Tax=Xanthomonas sp. GPE 39 TaxID=1583099 RepID=UPI00126A2BE2|nr:hypothetical protein [Xanthomonas sp. GPE 39]
MGRYESLYGVILFDTLYLRQILRKPTMSMLHYAHDVPLAEGVNVNSEYGARRHQPDRKIGVARMVAFLDNVKGVGITITWYAA